jgi:CDP-2,3-bis-(O-geranylgeranyl)-sn-glycerol synthase
VVVEALQWFIETVWQFLPAYFANAIPVLVHGGGPLDAGSEWIDNKRILGDHKTIYGTIAGIVTGSLVALVQGNPIQGILFAFGAILGDLFFAFIKRRLGINPGQPLPIWDQVGFIILAILLGSAVEPRPTVEQDIVMILVTIPAHYITNFFAWLLKWKKNPW